MFADTSFWLAITGTRDQWHDAAVRASEALRGCTIITTDEVLTEFLAGTSQGTARARSAAARVVRELLEDPDVLVAPQSRESFLGGLALYERRLDKTYSLVDCISMETMRAEGLTDILTNDRHFEQEGFSVLMRLEDA